MKKDYLRDKWGKSSFEMGWVSLPSSLLFLQRSFQISPIELNVLLHLIMHWWIPEEDPYPSQESIAKRIGVSKRTVQRAMQELEKNKIIEKTMTPRNHHKYKGRNVYSLRPLADRLEKETPELKKKFAHYQ